MLLASPDVTVYSIIRDFVGGTQIDDFSRVVLIPETLSSFGDENVSRAHLAMSLFLALYADLLDRVPHAREYFDRKASLGETIFLDHGAVRTVLSTRNGDLPPGEASLTRILVPLGYFHNHTYPLTKLRMTGRSYTHEDFPELIPQYFVSEFHPEQVGDDNFEKTVIKVVESSRDPLTADVIDDLTFLSENKFLPRSRTTNFLHTVSAAFTRQHEVPLLSHYEDLLSQSAEMAWISTEGNAFNHATDRVADVMALAENEKDLGNPIKDTVEVSGSGNVLQTAYKADVVSRPFIDETGNPVEKEVPGSFFEFITRKNIDDHVDLAFDASNATGIFGMTKVDDSPNEADED